MAGINHEALAAAMPWETDSFTILEPGDETRAAIPAAWWPVAESTDPDERKLNAMAAWNDDFLAMVPRFAQSLRAGLIDVRVVKHPWIDRPSLDYIVAGADGYAVWMGEDPTARPQAPPSFDSLPDPAQVFLRRVHAGFTTWDRESCGLAPPSLMRTLADHWGDPDDQSSIDWYETASPPPRMDRLLRITGRGPHADLLTSRDLPPGSAVTYFEPDFELTSFGDALDAFMTMPLEAS